MKTWEALEIAEEQLEHSDGKMTDFYRYIIDILEHMMWDPCHGCDREGCENCIYSGKLY